LIARLLPLGRQLACSHCRRRSADAKYSPQNGYNPNSYW
jgi:hypothetical protein